MIRLFDKTSLNFSTLGIGVLADCLSCEVTEELNGAYELEMEYPLTGLHYHDLEIDKIIVCPPDRYKNPQPFRIYSISKPLNGKVKIKAAHITYDMNYYPIRSFTASNLNSVLSEIQQKSILPLPFSFNSPDTSIQGAFSCEKARSLRSLFYDTSSDDASSIIDTYDVELDIDGFYINILPKNGVGGDQGVHIRYGKNLTSLTQDTTNDNNFTGIFPIYVSSQREQKEITVEDKEYEKIYTRSGVTPYTEEWLGWTENSAIPAIIPDDGKRHPLQIMSEGQYYEHIVIWDDDPNNPGKCKYFDVTNQQDQYPPTQTKFATAYNETYVTLTLYKEEGGVVTDNGVVYVSGRESDAFQKIMVVDFSQSFSSDEEPTEALLRTKAQEYITENKIGENEITVKASFIFLSDTSEYSEFLQAERIALGDTITVIYEALGVSDKLRIKKITYDAAIDKYISVELGDRAPYLAGEIIRTNDSISLLRNNSGYVNDTQLTGNIESSANNSWLSENQKQEIQNSFFNCPGVISASSDSLDQIVAKLLIVENAHVTNTLTAGQIQVKGKIWATDGEFSGTIITKGTDQSSIKILQSDNLDSNILTGHQASVNELNVENVLHLSGSTTQVINWYGWQCRDSISGNPRAEQLVTKTQTPVAGSTATYYYDTLGFYDNVHSYDSVNNTITMYGHIYDRNTSLDKYTITGASDLEVEAIDGTTVPVDVIFSASRQTYRDTSDQSIYVYVTLTASQAVPEVTSIKVYLTVKCSDEPAGPVRQTFNVSTTCTFANNSTTATSIIRIQNFRNLLYPTITNITSPTFDDPDHPYTKTYTVPISGTTLISVSNNFGPKSSNTYDLGAAQRLWKDIYASNAAIQTSDRRLKKDISYDLSVYDGLFDKLKPASFKLRDGQSGRTHIGLVAQDVKQSLEETGLSSNDFAAFIRCLMNDKIEKPTENDYLYGIRYSELISLCIYEIQKLKARINELESKEGS